MTSPLAQLTPESWPAVSALLDQALALPPPQRTAFIEALSGDQAPYRDTLLQLLAQATGVETGDFLATLPRLAVGGPAAADPFVEPSVGAMVGPYRLLSELGAGGMGTVWLAERADGTLKRKVALKLPRLAWGRGLAERMARERDILASLEHPHIARLYDAGVDQQGRPYLALEYVEGQPIDIYAKERFLSVRQKLDLLLQVCVAAAFAHSRLVVHRDLKPSNILVTADGQVRLLDFGIAKLMEGESTQETQLTQIAGRALTLDYASPEQIKGEPIGTASDVYSLGVVAYELLTGSKPYKLKRGSAAELEEAIATVDAPKASDAAGDVASRRVLRGDLDAILNKALKKAATDRYATIDAFAQDITRHLASEPVSAQRESRIYVLQRFMRRHRWPIAVTGLLAVTISAAAIVSTTQAVAARAQAKRATAAIGQQDAVRELYVEAMNTLASKAAADADALRQPNAVSHVLWQTMKEMLPRYRDRPPQTQALLQAVMLQLSYTGDFEGSLEVGRQFLDHMKQHGAEAWIVIDTHAAVARNLTQLGRSSESQAMLREALAWAPEAKYSAAERSRLNVASELAGDLMADGRLDEAKALLHEVEDKTRERYSDYRERADNLHRLAQFYFGVDDRRALQYARLAHDVLMASGSANRDSLLDSLGKMGVVMMANGLNPEAEQVLAEAHRLSVETYGRADRDTVRNLGRWAQALAAQGKFDAARQILATEQDALARLRGEDAERARIAVRARQAELEHAFGDVERALQLLSNRPDDVLSAAVGMDRIALVTQEARVLLLAGRADDALRRANAALEALDPRQRKLAAGLAAALTIVEAHIQAGQVAAARSTLDGVFESLQLRGTDASWQAVVALELRAVCLAALGMNAGARADLTAADARRSAIAVPNSLELAASELRRAQVLRQTGDSDGALRHARSALARLTEQHPLSPRLQLARQFVGV